MQLKSDTKDGWEEIAESFANTRASDAAGFKRNGSSPFKGSLIH